MSYHFGTSGPQNVQMLLSGVTLGPPELGLRMGPCPVDGRKEPPWGILGVDVDEAPLESKIDDWVASSPRGEVSRDEVFDRLWRRRRPKSLIADPGRFRICSRLAPIVCVEGFVAEPSGRTFVSVAGILVCVS